MVNLRTIVPLDDGGRLGERLGGIALDLRLGQADVRPLRVDLGRALCHRLVRRAVAATAGEYDVYAHPRVTAVLETGRVFAHRERAHYDVVALPLTDAYEPVTSGAYSLAETYMLTVQALADMLARLEPDGILVATRWLQLPPSEEVRLLATTAEALERSGFGPAADRLVAYRGIQTLTVLAQPRGWTEEKSLARAAKIME